MNEEEKQAIEDIRERVEEYEHYDMATFFTKDVRKLFEIIDKQQKEIEELNQVIKSKNKEIKLMKNTNLVEEHDKALKVIDKMAERINNETLGDIICDEICNKNCNKIDECKEEYVFVCKNCIKEYFYKEIET